MCLGGLCATASQVRQEQPHWGPLRQPDSRWRSQLFRPLCLNDLLTPSSQPPPPHLFSIPPSFPSPSIRTPPPPHPTRTCQNLPHTVHLFLCAWGCQELLWSQWTQSSLTHGPHTPLQASRACIICRFSLHSPLPASKTASLSVAPPTNPARRQDWGRWWWWCGYWWWWWWPGEGGGGVSMVKHTEFKVFEFIMCEYSLSERKVVITPLPPPS